MFSFNSPDGACPACRGLGVEDRIDPELLVADPGRTLRQGALALTTPNGYIIYSQVTMDVLDQVCRAHGFSVDIPWRDLTVASAASSSTAATASASPMASIRSNRGSAGRASRQAARGGLLQGHPAGHGGHPEDEAERQHPPLRPDPALPGLRRPAAPPESSG